MREEITKYNYKYQLQIGDTIKVDGLPLEYLENNRFGTNTKMHFEPKNKNNNSEDSTKVVGGEG